VVANLQVLRLLPRHPIALTRQRGDALVNPLWHTTAALAVKNPVLSTSQGCVSVRGLPPEDRQIKRESHHLALDSGLAGAFLDP